MITALKQSVASASTERSAAGRELAPMLRCLVGLTQWGLVEVTHVGNRTGNEIQAIIHAEGVGCWVDWIVKQHHPRRRRAQWFFIIRAGGAAQRRGAVRASLWRRYWK